MDAPSFMRIITYSGRVPITLQIKEYTIFISSSSGFRIGAEGLTKGILADKANSKDKKTS
jgi:hypothetical protein